MTNLMDKLVQALEPLLDTDSYQITDTDTYTKHGQEILHVGWEALPTCPDPDGWPRSGWILADAPFVSLADTDELSDAVRYYLGNTSPHFLRGFGFPHIGQEVAVSNLFCNNR